MLSVYLKSKYYVLLIGQKEAAMKLAIIGSRGLWVENLGDYLPSGVTEIVSGGAKGIDNGVHM